MEAKGNEAALIECGLGTVAELGLELGLELGYAKISTYNLVFGTI